MFDGPGKTVSASTTAVVTTSIPCKKVETPDTLNEPVLVRPDTTSEFVVVTPETTNEPVVVTPVLLIVVLLTLVIVEIPV